MEDLTHMSSVNCSGKADTNTLISLDEFHSSDASAFSTVSSEVHPLCTTIYKYEDDLLSQNYPLRIRTTELCPIKSKFV
jgi:hypothetical protein